MFSSILSFSKEENLKVRSQNILILILREKFAYTRLVSIFKSKIILSHLFILTEMNSTFTDVSLIIHVDRGFLFFDIFSFICTVFVIVVAIIFLLIIIFDETCHTIPMLLIGNSCLAELICGTVIFCMNVYTFQNDLNQLPYQDSLCVFRGYLSLSSCAIQNYSFLLQSIYRYTTVVYPNSLFWKSARTQILLIVLTWILAFAYPFPFIFTGEYIYDADNGLCQIPLRLSFSIVFVAFFIYLIPINMILFSYSKLVRYVKEISKRVTPVNMILHAQRELQIYTRILFGTTWFTLYSLYSDVIFYDATKIPFSYCSCVY
jgi:hypothetical protein